MEISDKDNRRRKGNIPLSIFLRNSQVNYNDRTHAWRDPRESDIDEAILSEKLSDKRTGEK